MSALTIPQVREWRPEALDTAADSVGKASTAVDDQARSVGRSLEDALTEAGGKWAAAARDRAADEAKIGAQLADALDTARQVLARGSTDIGHARTHLLNTIGSAQSQGFTVADDGTVTPPTLPPVMTSPEQAEAAVSARNARQMQLNTPAQGFADDISAALSAVAHG